MVRWVKKTCKEDEYVRFAVTTPRCIELDQHVLLVVHDDILVVLGHNHSDGAILLLGHRLTLDAWLKLSGDEIVDELAHGLGVYLLILRQGILLILHSLLDGERWPLSNFKIEVLAVLTKGLGVNGSNVDCALVLLGDWL